MTHFLLTTEFPLGFTSIVHITKLFMVYTKNSSSLQVLVFIALGVKLLKITKAIFW